MRMTSCKPAFLLNEYRGAVMLQGNQILYKKPMNVTKLPVNGLS